MAAKSTVLGRAGRAISISPGWLTVYVDDATVKPTKYGELFGRQD